MLLPLLLACGPALESDLDPVHTTVGTDPGTATDSGTVPDSGTGTDSGTEPYLAEETVIEPSLDLDQIATAVTQAIASAKAVDGRVLFEGYRAGMQGRDAACPYTNPDYQTYYGVDYWYDACTAASGYSFNGYGYGYQYDPYWSGTVHYSDSAYLYGDAAITWPDGTTYTASGTASYTHYDESTYDYGVMSLYTFGLYEWDAPEAAGTWLADGLSTSLSVYAVDYRLWGSRLVVFDGGLSHMEGVVNAVVFDQLYAANAAYGSPCEAEPGGSVSLRDAEGEWYDVVFDGADYGSSTAFPPECDGCGHVWFRGEAIGDVCPDLGGLLQWEGWEW